MLIIFFISPYISDFDMDPSSSKTEKVSLKLIHQNIQKRFPFFNSSEFHPILFLFLICTFSHLIVSWMNSVWLHSGWRLWKYIFDRDAGNKVADYRISSVGYPVLKLRSLVRKLRDWIKMVTSIRLSKKCKTKF